MSSPAIDTQALVEAAKTVTGILPSAGKAAVFKHLLSGMTQEELQALSTEARGKLLQALAGTQAATSAVISPAVGCIETVDGHQAVLGKISVNSQTLDTLLTEGSFSKARTDQIAYAAKLGCRLATREEHLEYVNGLLGKEADGSINAAESHALDTYRRRYVRDTSGGLDVYGRRVRAYSFIWYNGPSRGALFVRASAEAK